ncbi:hypothetical protein LdCL_170011300 [Leishmania donovani]|uniref:Uncharacterized protein n=1 Tax=Leishmania donovani TaxID=5661 RepID=A0A3S7WUD7_LEIDO|nr:hypothetical protein LdCL_170011300 [Leishmania donovani]
MAHLLDSVASPSSTSPSRTPTRSSSSLQSHKAAHPSSRQRHPPQQQRWSSSAQVAAHPMRRANVERAGGSPEWDRRTPTRQQQSHRSAQRRDPLPASWRAQQGPAATTEGAAATYTSSISVDDEVSSRFSATQLTEMRERHDSDWASPSEVLQLRTLFQDLTSRYMREVQALKGELAKAQEECAAYAREREKVLELQQVYQDGVAACGRAKEREAQWVEERALLHVQMEKMMVENQWLQLYIAKKQQPHIHHMPPRGSATGSRERVRAAVQAVASAATATSSASPSPSASWPPLPPTATATTTNTTGYLAPPQPLDGPDTKIFASLPGAAEAAVTGTVQTEATSPYTFLSASSSPEELQYRAPQRGGGVAAETPLPPMPSPTSHQSALARPASPISAAASAGAQPPHSTPLQRTFPTDIGDDAGADLPGGDGDHGDTLHQQQRGRSRRHPRGGANHDEEPHNSSLMTPSVSTSDEGRLGAGKAVRLPRQQRVRLDGGDNEVDNTTGEGEFNPSYARGVTDLSSTSGGSSSPSPATNIRSMLAGSGLAQVHEQRSGGHSDDGGRRAAEQWGGELVADRAAAVAAAAELPATATATATTTTTPSLGSTAMTTAPSSLSLQYLYQLPRTPAEALQEEVQMLKELRRLGEENQVLKARLDYMQVTKEIFTNQCEQQHLRLAQAHDQSRHSAAQWELSSRQLASEVRQLEAKCAELQGALEDVLQQAKRQQELSQARLVELEASSRAALVATRDEAIGKVGALRSSLREIAASLAATSASKSSPAAGHEVAQLREEAGQCQRIVENLRNELHALRTAHSELQDEHSALQAEAQMHRTRLEGDLASSRELLAAACSDQRSAESRIAELEAEVERLRSAVVSSEGLMHTMEERLRLATDELASQQEQLDEASTWQARALSAESELSTQRSYYEKEISVYKTAACAMQDRHHAEVEGLLKRYEKLQVRHEAAKVRLAAAVSRSGAAAVFAAAGGHARRRHSRHAKSEDRGAPVISGNPTDTASHSPPTAVKTEASSTDCAAAAYDSLQALRISGQVTEKLIRSLNRATSPYH